MITQLKTGKEIWVPLSKETLDLVDGLERMSTYIVVSEETGRPYDKNTFGRIFRKFRRRAGISNVTFQDLRRTVATELGNRGATEAEIVSITGHAFGSKEVGTYVNPDREAALRAFAKRKSNKKPK